MKKWTLPGFKRNTRRSDCLTAELQPDYRDFSGAYRIKKFTQIFLDTLIITGRKTTRVTTIAIKVFNNEAPRNRNEITKAATANAMPTA